MNIVFRTDASTWIGTGHVMRCAVLAKHLQRLGATILFLCREMPGDLCNLLEEQKLPVHRLPFSNIRNSETVGAAYNSWLGVTTSQEILESEVALKEHGLFDWLVVDHYGLDFEWHRTMVNRAHKIFVIDDLACNQQSCDILLNHAYLPGLREIYSSLTPPNTKLLLGPDYFILNPEFQRENYPVEVRDGQIRKILIFYGGVDATDETRKIVEAIADFQQHDIHVDVVITERYLHRREISTGISALPNMSLHIQLPSLAKLMSEASISFGAGGGTTYERLFFGLPSIVTTTAANQVASIRYMHEENLVCWLGNAEDVQKCDLLNALTQAIENSSNLCEQSRASSQIVDGKSLDRIANLLASH